MTGQRYAPATDPRPASRASEGDRLGTFARTVGIAGVALTIGTGLGLWLLPGETEQYWAWVIKAPLSAAFLGAGYVGAATSFVLALRSGRWSTARTSYVSAFALTVLALVATFRQLDTFLLGTGDVLPRTTARIWLAVYVTLPPLVVLAFVVQQRGRTGEPVREAPLARSSSVLLGAWAAALTVAGVLLFAESTRLVEAWPWPLTPLTAELIGGWVLTAAVTLWWVVVADPDWRRARAAVAGALVFGGLLLLAALRLRDGLDWPAAAVYLGALAAMVIVVGAVAVREHRRHAG